MNSSRPIPENFRILVVDDDKYNRYMLETLLKQKGYKVESAVNGKEALEILNTGNFDMVLSDILMPVMDGFQLCRELRKNEKLKHIFIIFYTATYIDEKDEELAYRVGANKYIRKPVRLAELIKAIEETIKETKEGKIEEAKPVMEETEDVLNLYSERLVKKLEQKNLEIQESERKFRQLYENVNDMIFYLNEKGIFTSLNHRIEMFGYIPEDFIGKHFTELFTPKSRESAIKYYEKVKKFGGTSGTSELEVKEKRGSIKVIELSMSAVLSEGDKFQGVWGIARDITERKWIEEELRRAEKEWRHTFDSISDFVSVLDRGLRIIKANKALVDFLGVKTEDIVGKNCCEVIHKTKKPWHNCPHLKMLKLKKAVTEEVDDPNVGCPLLITASPICDENGKIMGSVHIAKDITEHKQVEKELYRVNRALKVLSRCNQTVIRSTDESDLLRNICSILVQQGGYRFAWVGFAEQDRARTVRPVAQAGYEEGYLEKLNITWADTEQGRGPTGTAIRTGKPVIARNILTDPNFAPWREEAIKRGFASSIALPLITGSETLGALNIYSNEPDAFDVEEVKLLKELTDDLVYGIMALQIQRKHKQALETLKENQRALSTLLSNLPGMAYRCKNDREWTMEFVSEGCYKLTGYQPSDITGNRKLSYADIIHPDDRESVWDEVQKALSEKRSFTLIYRIITASGEERWVWEQGQGVFSSRGEIIALEGFISDITERKQAEMERENLQAQLFQAQKMESIGHLAGGIAHDFKNTLTVIKGYTELLLEDIPLEHPKRTDIETMNRAIERANSLTSQLLIFSGKPMIKPKVFNLNTIISYTKKMLQHTIGEHIEFKINLAPSLGNVKTDPTQIEQVIMNLVLNARDAMPEGGKLTIETKNVELGESYASTHFDVQPGEYIMLSVSDTGVGIPPEIKDRIFEPLFTTKEKEKGTGLGLSVVYRIVKQSGGNIQVYSEHNEGTIFKVYLPRVYEPEDELKKKEGEKEILAGDETILLVEDEEDVRKISKIILKKQGYKVLEAEDGKSALQICKEYKEPIHLLLTDVVMPEMSVSEIVKGLREICPDIRVLYMSGYIYDKIVDKEKFTGEVNFIQKPFTSKDLLNKVREALDK